MIIADRLPAVNALHHRAARPTIARPANFGHNFAGGGQVF